MNFSILNGLTILLIVHPLGIYAQKFVQDISQCPPLEPRASPARDISDLRPDDIRVVMALGDSVTAGFGAKLISILDTRILQEYRGLSFCMGGDPNAQTVANFIRNYRSDLLGASRGSHFVELCFGGIFCAPDELAYRPQQDMFNAALSGAVSGTLGLELKYLLKQLTKHQSIDIEQDWKLLTIFIGGNEVCHSSCEEKEEGAPGTATDFERKLTITLQAIQEKIPRTLVNILLIPDLSQVEKFSNSHPRCLPGRGLLSSICPCAMKRGQPGRWAMRRVITEYNRRLIRITKRFNSKAKEKALSEGRPLDFGIIISPILRDLDLRNDTPVHFASKLDCFHPSASAHKSMAIGIWRDLFLPFKERSTHLLEQDEIYCPTEDDRIIIDL